MGEGQANMKLGCLAFAAAAILGSAHTIAADTEVNPAEVQAYRDAARRQAEFEASAFQAGTAARAAWFDCIARVLAPTSLALAREAPTMVLRTAMGKCEAAEETTLRRWALAGGPALAHRFLAETEKAITNAFVPIILKFKAGGYGPVPK